MGVFGLGHLEYIPPNIKMHLGGSGGPWGLPGGVFRQKNTPKSQKWARTFWVKAPVQSYRCFWPWSLRIHPPPTEKCVLVGRGAPGGAFWRKNTPKSQMSRGGKGLMGHFWPPKKPKKYLPSIYCVTATCHMPHAMNANSEVWFRRRKYEIVNRYFFIDNLFIGIGTSIKQTYGVFWH